MSELWLTVREGTDAGREWPLIERLVIGRGGGADIELDDPTVSRRHAALAPEGDTAVVEDLGSTNGTFVNDRPVEQPRRIGADDRLQIGDHVLALRLGPTESLTPPGEPTVVREQSGD